VLRGAEGDRGDERPAARRDAGCDQAAGVVECRDAIGGAGIRKALVTSLAPFLVRRLGAAALLVAIVSTSALVITRLAPGDATDELFLSGASQAQIDAARARWG